MVSLKIKREKKVEDDSADVFISHRILIMQSSHAASFTILPAPVKIQDKDEMLAGLGSSSTFDIV